MGDEETVPSGRRTRSGRVTKSPKAAVTTRRNKRRAVVADVDISEEDEVSTAAKLEEKTTEESDEAECNIETLRNTVDEEMSKIAAEYDQIKEDLETENGNIKELNLEDFVQEVNEIVDMDVSDTKEDDDNGLIEEEEIPAQEEEITAPKEEVIAPKEEITAPKEEIIAAKEEIAAPKEDIAAPKEIAEPEEDIAAAEENISEEEVKDQSESMDCDNSDQLLNEENGLENLSDSEMPDAAAAQNGGGDPDAENISEDELPGVPVAKVPETEEVSDEELPGPKRAELPADTEVVSEDELPSTTGQKKEGTKRKLEEGDYDPTSPTSENEAPTKKAALDPVPEKEKEKEEKPPKPKKLPELDKYWKAVNDDPSDFTGWTYLLQYVDQENDMEAAREAYDAFLSHYPYCYGYWRKYADYEKRKGNKKKCEEVFERGLKAIPLSVDLWIHYLTYVKTGKPDDEACIRSQFERAIAACGLEFRSDRLWDSYIKWETEAKRLQQVTAIYDRLLATPTQGYTSHFDNFQEHISSNPPNKVVEVDEFLALRKEVRQLLKHDVDPSAASDAPPGDEEQTKLISSDEETKSIRERIVSIRRKIHKNTVTAVTARWNYEEGIKRPYFHVKPLERCQLKNWQDYLDYEIEQADRVRTIVLFERCLIACALYEEFWLKFVHYLESLKDVVDLHKIRDVYERACTIHHLKKPNLHLQWAMFEECVNNGNRAAEILVNLEKSVPNVLQVAYRRINLERRRGDNEKCIQLFEHYIGSLKNKMIASNIAIKYSRYALKVLKDLARAQEIIKTAIAKDGNNARLYLQLIDLTLQKQDATEAEVVELLDLFLDKEGADVDQKVLFAQRKMEYLEDFGVDIQAIQAAHDQYQKLVKMSKDGSKKKDSKGGEGSSSSKKDKNSSQGSSQPATYGNYNYGGSSGQTSYPYSGGQQGQYNYSQYQQSGDQQQYQYQNWQYPQGGYGNYNQWGSYGGGYGY